MILSRRALARRLAAAAAALALGCAGPAASGPPPPRGLSAADARSALGRFVAALEEGRAQEAHALLSARWRAGSSPARLQTDLRGAGPYAVDQLARVRAALAAGAPVEIADGAARVPLGDGRAAALVAEGGGWRVDALE
jgi:hypothetical protein